MPPNRLRPRQHNPKAIPRNQAERIVIDLDELAHIKGTLARNNSEELVEQYMQQKRDGSPFPEIEIYRTPDGKWRLRNGNHRMTAARRLGEKTIAALDRTPTHVKEQLRKLGLI